MTGGHIVEYAENGAGTVSWAKCSCLWVGSKRNGGAHETSEILDKDAERHINQQS